MEGFLKLSTAVNVTILMIDSSDHVTGKTGLSAGLTMYLTKAAGTPTSITPTVTELDSTNAKGLYKLAFTTGHTDTLGEFQLHITASGADPTDIKWQVSTYLPGEAATLQASQSVTVAAFAAGQDSVTRRATAQAGAASTITLDASASATDHLYEWQLVSIVSGTGVGQTRLITGYVGSTKVATIAPNWTTSPDNTSLFVLEPWGRADVGYLLETIFSTPATAGILDVNVKNIANAAVDTTAAQIGVNVVNWKGSTAPAMTGDAFARLGAPAGASVSADIAAVKTDTAAVKLQTDKLAFTVTNQVDANVLDWKSATAPAMTGDAFARLGAPAGASVSADVAAVKSDSGAIKVQTDKLAFTVSNQVDANVLDWKSATAPAMTGDAFARLGAPAGASVSADVAAVLAKSPDSAHYTNARGDKLDDLDATISSRLASASYTAPDNSDIVAIKAKTDNLPPDPADASDIAALFAALPSAATIASTVWSTVVENSTSALQMVRGFAAALLGKATITATTAVYRDTGDSKDRISATVDDDGNRSAVTLDLS